ncbi:MAG: hypothetical protein ACTHK1_17065 [Actinomycetales bacterium]
MARARIMSVGSPFRDDPESASVAFALLNRLVMMGLVEPVDIEQLDDVLVVSWLSSLKERHIGSVAAVEDHQQRWLPTLRCVMDAVEHSPLPETEWATVSAVLGDDLLSRLLGISGTSLRRYGSGQRHTPDAVAARLHFLALVVADLEGAYNDAGIRGWFERRRPQLQGQTPRDLLIGEWHPDDEGPVVVRSLASALVAVAAS